MEQSQDDAALALRTQSGDTLAFGLLYDRYVERIYRFIYYKTFVKETAEDITSDVFSRAFQKIHSFDATRGSFSMWIYRIARNAVIDHYRTEHRSVPIDDIFDLGESDRTPEALDATRALEKVSEYLKTLPARQREIITLRVWEERSYREIAEIVGGSEDSVKMAFSRSIRALRDACGPLALYALTVLGASSVLPFHDIS